MNDLQRHAERLMAASTVIAGAGSVIVRSLGDVVKASVDRQIGQDVPRRRVAGASVGVKIVNLPTQAGIARVLVTATGPLHLENNPTRPHLIAPKGPHPLAYVTSGGVIFASRVRHPGTRGKRTWQQGVDQSLPLVGAQVDKEGAALLRQLR